jgi:hypothetical protein
VGGAATIHSYTHTFDETMDDAVGLGGLVHPPLGRVGPTSARRWFRHNSSTPSSQGSFLSELLYGNRDIALLCYKDNDREADKKVPRYPRQRHHKKFGIIKVPENVDGKIEAYHCFGG